MVEAVSSVDKQSLPGTGPGEPLSHGALSFTRAESPLLGHSHVSCHKAAPRPRVMSEKPPVYRHQRTAYMVMLRVVDIVAVTRNG